MTGRTADGRVELFTRRLERVSDQFPDVVELLADDPGAGKTIPFSQAKRAWERPRWSMNSYVSGRASAWVRS